MPRYLCIHRREPGSGEKPSPAQMEKMYGVFNAWREKFRAQIVDMGGQLKRDGKVVTTDGATDGPFVEAREVVGGYMIVSADDLEGAIEVVRQSPALIVPGASVEIREIHTP